MSGRVIGWVEGCKHPDPCAVPVTMHGWLRRVPLRVRRLLKQARPPWDEGDEPEITAARLASEQVEHAPTRDWFAYYRSGVT